MAPKRQHKTLTLAEKNDILQQLSSGLSGKILADKYGVGTSTISDIKKNSDKIKRYVRLFMCKNFANVVIFVATLEHVFLHPVVKKLCEKGNILEWKLNCISGSFFSVNDRQL